MLKIPSLTHEARFENSQESVRNILCVISLTSKLRYDDFTYMCNIVNVIRLIHYYTITTRVSFEKFVKGGET